MEKAFKIVMIVACVIGLYLIGQIYWDRITDQYPDIKEQGRNFINFYQDQEEDF